MAEVVSLYISGWDKTDGKVETENRWVRRNRLSEM